MKKYLRAASLLTAAAVILCCVYIMANGIGLVPELDFGAGAYYYADIPDFDRFTEPADNAVQKQARGGVPAWACFVLFFAWGYLMWRLWVRSERRK